MADTGQQCDIPVPIQYIGCQDLLELKCTHCGWLRKRRTLKLFSWPQAYVVLHEGCLYYFKNERARGAAGRFSLYGYNAVYRACEILPREAPWCFKIVHSHSGEFKTYYFSASSEQEMKVWMSKIKLEMLHANGKSAIYGKNLQFVKEKPDRTSDDPSFYQNVEENIYDDSSKFIPSTDYQKKCSIKRINEDSEDEEIEINPAINERPPQPLPHSEGPFINLPTPDRVHVHPPITIPLKPPRIVETKEPAAPAIMPRIRRIIPAQSEAQVQSDEEPMDKWIDTPPANAGTHKKSPKSRRRGSYEEANGPENMLFGRREANGPENISFGRREANGPENMSFGRQGEIQPVPRNQGSVNSGGGGSTGSDDQSDAEEDWSEYFFEGQDKQKATEIIQCLGEDGVYLVRRENTGQGMVLVVFANEQSKKYRIQWLDGQYFLQKGGFHHTYLDSLLKHYYSNSLPTVDIMLKTPYKLHPAYKLLNL